MAGFGEEVAAEAEHVCPSAQRPPRLGLSEGPGGVDEPFGVSTRWVGVQVDGVRVEGAGGVPGGLAIPPADDPGVAEQTGPGASRSFVQ